MAYNFSETIFDIFSDFLSKKKIIMQNVLSESIYDNQHIDYLLRTDTYLDESIVIELKKMKCIERRQHKIDNIDFIFEFCDNIKSNKRIIDFMFNYTCFMIYFLSKISSVPRNLKIYLFNYKGKKYIPEDGIFKSINVNSGMTISYDIDNAVIIVYRKEEMIKVLTHELIHAFNIDAKYISSDLTINLKNHFCLVGEININETFTDTLACLINIIMFTILEDSHGNNFKKRLNINMKKECNHMYAQARKVLLINKYDLDNNMKCVIENKEETHGIAYYVLKAIIFKKAILFLKNNNYMLKDIDEFILLIYNSLNDVNWNIFGKKQLLIQKEKNSLRMSSVDIIDLIKNNQLQNKSI